MFEKVCMSVRMFHFRNYRTDFGQTEYRVLHQVINVYLLLVRACQLQHLLYTAKIQTKRLRFVLDTSHGTNNC